MTSPTPASLIANLRPDIQGMFEEFSLELNAQRMIAHLVFPIFDVGLQAGPWGKITLESLLKAVDDARNSSSTYNTANFEFTDDSYSTTEHGIAVPVDKRMAAIYRNYFDAEVVAARLARHIVMVNYEMRVSALLMNASTFNTTGATAVWSNKTTSRPIDDVEAAVLRLYDKGIIANSLVMSWKVFRYLRHSEQVIDRIVASGAGNPAKPEDITTDMLAAIFDLPKILVGGAQRNNAKEGQAASLTPIWPTTHVSVTRITDGSIEDPGVGRTFHWDGDGSSPAGTMESYYDNEIRGDKIRCRMETQEKVIYTEAAELISGVTA